VPDPVPDAPLEMTTHAALLDAVQAHPGDVVTATVPAPPAAANAWLPGAIVKEHEVAGCVIVNIFPAIVIVPLREMVPVLAVTE
jgi:hypothetical protein